MANYTINFINGTATQNMEVGTYDVAVNTIPGYTGALSQAQVIVADDATEISMTVAATATATITVNDSVSGTGVAGIDFLRADDALATHTYAPLNNAIVDNADGTYTVKFLPYNGVTPVISYFKMSKVDYEDATISVSMDAETVVVVAPYTIVKTEVEKALNMTDTNYDGLDITGSVDFTGVI